MAIEATRRDGSAGRRWVILAVLFVARTVIAFQFQSVAAIGPVLVQDLGIDYALLGTIVGLYMLPGVAFAFPGGMLGQRFGDKRIVVLGLALMVVGGILVAGGTSSTLVGAGRLISGTGAVLLNILLAKMVTDWFAEREIVLAMALFVSSWPVGIGLALIVVPGLASTMGTAAALGSAALLSVVGLAVVLAGYRPPAGLVATPATFRMRLSRREWRLTILSGLVWALYNVAFIVLLVFGPSLLSSRGMPIATAGATVSLATWTALLSLPLGGYLAQRLNSPDAVMVGAFLALAVALSVLPLGFSPLFVCAALGILVGPPAGLIMALPGASVQPQNRAAGMGVYYTCYYAAMAALVPVAGALRDATQSPAAPLYFAAATACAAAVSLVGFRLLQRRPTDAAATAPA
jgi:cyanate permease